MKVESNLIPEDNFEIENIIDGKCEIVFYDNIKELEPLESGDSRYSFDMYRLTTTYREELKRELKTNKKYKIWLELAKKNELKRAADDEIATLQKELDNTDYKIIKCSEYQLAGLELPYNIAELHEKRQTLRDKINELQEL